MTQLQKEELRRLTLGWLAERAALAFSAASIHRGVNRELPHTPADAEAALSMLLDLGLLREVPNRLGATRYYKISAAGTIAHERGE